jgi:hypothetical protein
MMLTSLTFVLQRRINQPLATVEHALCDPQRLRAGATFELGSDSTLVTLDGPFGVTFPPFGLEGASWRALATVRRRRRRVVLLELEINAWDSSSTELVVRPRAARPWRWSGGRLHEYFRVAHLTADRLTQVLSAPAPADAAPEPRTIPTMVTT